MVKHYIHPSRPGESFMLDGFYREHDEYVKDGFVELFDTRYLNDIRGRCDTLVLENDVYPPDYLVKMAEEISKLRHNPKLAKLRLACSLSPDHVKDILSELTKDRVGNVNWYNNVLIDSLFQDGEQFRFIVNKLFNKADINYRLTFIINSHGTLIDTLNNFSEAKDEFSETIKRFVQRHRIYDMSDENDPYMQHVIAEGNAFKYDKSYPFIMPWPRITEWKKEEPQKSKWEE